MLGESVRTRRGIVGGAAVVVLFAGFGCTAESRSGTDQPGVPGPPAVSTAAPNPADQTSIARSSDDDLAAALRTNDVDDPGEVAELVSNNRPYPAGDAGTAKLRDVLTRAGLDPDTVTTVTAALVP